MDSIWLIYTTIAEISHCQRCRFKAYAIFDSLILSGWSDEVSKIIKRGIKSKMEGRWLEKTM